MITVLIILGIIVIVFILAVSFIPAVNKWFLMFLMLLFGPRLPIGPDTATEERGPEKALPPSEGE